MTRETKIGLLVGLAFIIVIGILLSDHLSSTTEPPPAQLAQAGASVRQGVNAPGVSSNVPPVTTIAPAPTQSIVQQQVPTQEELSAPRPQPIVKIGIGPASTGNATGNAANPNNAQPPVTFVQPEVGEATSGQTNIPPVETQIAESNLAGDPLAEIARRAGEPIVGLDGAPIQNTSGLAGNTGAQPTAPLPNGFKEYKAGEGDTVSRMAGRFLGENTPANRDLIIKSNPSLQKNPDIVVSGRTYRIPITQPAQSAVETATKTSSPVSIPATSENIYTVKPGDSLWRIANDELGNAAAVSAIKELNSDVLKGGEVVQIGMKLKLPAKSVASAQ